MDVELYDDGDDHEIKEVKHNNNVDDDVDDVITVVDLAPSYTPLAKKVIQDDVDELADQFSNMWREVLVDETDKQAPVVETPPDNEMKLDMKTFGKILKSIISVLNVYGKVTRCTVAPGHNNSRIAIHMLPAGEEGYEMIQASMMSDSLVSLAKKLNIELIDSFLAAIQVDLRQRWVTVPASWMNESNFTPAMFDNMHSGSKRQRRNDDAPVAGDEQTRVRFEKDVGVLAEQLQKKKRNRPVTVVYLDELKVTAEHFQKTIKELHDQCRNASTELAAIPHYSKRKKLVGVFICCRDVSCFSMLFLRQFVTPFVGEDKVSFISPIIAVMQSRALLGCYVC